MRFSHLTSGDGLCNDYIKCIFQDHTGFIWMGTYDGLCRYDGAHFILYRRDFTNPHSLPSNTIYDIKEDSLGILWISTGKGICHYDPKTRQVTRNELPGTEPLLYCLSMEAVNGHLWLATGSALYDYRIAGRGILQLQKKYGYPAANGAANERLCKDQQGRLWLLAQGKLYRPDTALQQLIPVPFSDSGQLLIKDVTTDKTGNLWLSDATKPALLRCTIHKNNAVIDAVYPLADNAGAGSFHTIKAVSGVNGNASEKILMATQGAGLYVFDPAKALFLHIANNSADAYSLSNNLVTDILQDASGLVWITTGYGANIYDPARQQLQTLFLPAAETFGLITESLPDKDFRTNAILWLGTDQNELVCYNYHTAATTRYRLPGKGDRIQHLFQQDDGTLWIGGYIGLYQLPDGSKNINQVLFKAKGPYSISCIRQLPDKTLLIASFENGIWKYQPGKGIIQHMTTANGLFSNRCTYLSGGAGGHFYVTHIAPGISIANVNTGQAGRTDFQPFLEHEMQYPAAFTYCSYPDSAGQILWVGTGLGLVRYDLQHKTGRLLEATTRLNTDNEIWSIIPEGKDHLWLKTTFGVYKFNKRRLTVDEFFTLERKHIPSQDGYFRMSAVNDKLILPAYRSFHILRTKKYASTIAQSRIVLLEAFIDGKETAAYSDTGHLSLVLKPGQTSLALNFTSLNFRYPEFTRYSYRLSGADDKWYALGDRTSLSFANLKPGHYTLEIKAENQSPETVIKPLLASIAVQPFFWQTYWFYLLLLFIIALAVYGLYRYRINQVLAMQRIRQKISKDLHDDIGATISSIGLLATMARTDQVAPEKKKQFLERIIEQSRSVSQSLSDIVWSINPQNDQLEVVFARIQRFAAELFEAGNIQYSMEFPPEEQLKFSMTMIARQHIYLIFKEAINNIVKYAAASQVRIIVSIQGKILQVEIADDGRGFDKEKVTMGNGIYNMQKRVAELKGSFVIETAEGKGTLLRVQVPL